MAQCCSESPELSAIASPRPKGDKIKNIIIKLHETHDKEKFLIFTEASKGIKLETFPKKAPEIK
eukprot:14770886-Ditylum_brightwellii.AAC.1